MGATLEPNRSTANGIDNAALRDDQLRTYCPAISISGSSYHGVNETAPGAPSSAESLEVGGADGVFSGWRPS